MLNAFTVDLEDWYQSFYAAPPEPPGGWPSRVRVQLDTILDLLSKTRAKATFFVVGELAERDPGLVQEIVSRGHEVGCHGYRHKRLAEVGRRRFREDLRRALDVLGSASGRQVVGFRAPWFSLERSTWWAVESLVDEGITFDSSLFPVWNPIYGTFGCLPRPHRIPAGDGRALWEIPPAPTRLLGIPFPMAGGFCLRNAPLWLAAATIDLHNRLGLAAVLYVHPWELDPAQSVPEVGRWERAVHCAGLAGWRERLSWLLARSEFASVETVFGHLWRGENCDRVAVQGRPGR